MKNSISILVFLFISFSIYSQSESQTVMIKSVETYGSFASMKRSLHIVDEAGEVTTIELERHNTNGIPINMVTVKKELDKYLNQDYELISSNAVSFGWNGVFTIEHSYILKKADKNQAQ